MNFLFISARFDAPFSGGRSVAHSHYEALCSIAGSGGEVVSTHYRKKNNNDDIDNYEENRIPVISLKRRSMKYITGLLIGRTNAYSLTSERRIIDFVKENNCNFVWFDEMRFGSTIKKIKRECPDVTIFAFSHVVEESRFKSIVKNNIFRLKGIFRIWEYIHRLKQQRLSAKYADISVVLNERDRETFVKRYGAEPDLILPVCFIDNAEIFPVERKQNEFNLFFIGYGHHKPNIDSIKWFAVNVMPYVDQNVTLQIAGAYMDEFRNEPEFLNNPKIKIMGRVENLAPLYNAADIVIVPILYGAGMMTKVAEALMYGKNILATDHALNGYEDIMQDCMCLTAEDFIRKINEAVHSDVKRFNPDMRRLYEEKYSISAMAGMINKALIKERTKHK